MVDIVSRSREICALEGFSGTLSAGLAEDGGTSDTLHTVTRQLQRVEKHPEAACQSVVARLAALFLCHEDAASTQLKYHKFIMLYYDSALYQQEHPTVGVAAMRLFQRYLCTCSLEELIAAASDPLHAQREYGLATSILETCWSLASNYICCTCTPPTPLTMHILSVLQYDVLDASPLDFLEVVAAPAGALHPVCERAVLLLMSHQSSFVLPSSAITALALVYVATNSVPSDTKPAGDRRLSFVSWGAAMMHHYAEISAFLATFG